MSVLLNVSVIDTIVTPTWINCTLKTLKPPALCFIRYVAFVTLDLLFSYVKWNKIKKFQFYHRFQSCRITWIISNFKVGQSYEKVICRIYIHAFIMKMYTQSQLSLILFSLLHIISWYWRTKHIEASSKLCPGLIIFVLLLDSFSSFWAWGLMTNFSACLPIWLTSTNCSTDDDLSSMSSDSIHLNKRGKWHSITSTLLSLENVLNILGAKSPILCHKK